MNAPAITIANLEKRYGRTTALDDVSLTVGAGERLALVGHNGAGKTTMVKAILGLLRPNAGTVRVNGADPADPRNAGLRKDIGFLPENVIFNGAARGHEVLRFYAVLKGADRAEIQPLLENLGLTTVADRPVRTYSKGMRQRLGLAQALIGAPRLLILDEPTSGLDPILRRWFYRRLDEMAHDGATIVLSSHALTELALRTDRVAILDRGRLSAVGSVDELAARASLPMRIRVRVPDGTASALAARLGASAESARVNDRQVELTCTATSKMALLRQLATLGTEVLDIEVDGPSLEDVYARFQGEGPRP